MVCLGVSGVEDEEDMEGFRRTEVRRGRDWGEVPDRGRRDSFDFILGEMLDRCISPARPSRTTSGPRADQPHFMAPAYIQTHASDRLSAADESMHVCPYLRRSVYTYVHTNHPRTRNNSF